MKRNLFGFVIFCLSFSTTFNAQVLNEPAGWPSSAWSVTGSYNAAGFDEDPTASDKFSFDDDNAGSGSTDDIAAESPVVDLTAAFNAGETWITVSGDFVYNWFSNNELLAIQYWDADAASWVTWFSFPQVDTPGAPFQEYCTGTPVQYETSVLNIAAFTANQLSAFKYRIYFDDNITGASGWDYGFCFESPTIVSQVPPTCPDPSGLAATNVGGSDATITWQAGSTETAWEYVIQPAGTGVPTGSGAPQASTTVMETGLAYSTAYEVYVRADCSGSGFSDWVGPLTFTTTIQTDFSVDCAVGPINNNFCYFNNIDDDPSVATFTFTSTDGSPLWLTFNSGSIESCCDELVVIDSDGTQLFNATIPSGDVSGLSFQSSGDTISFYINSDISVSCESGSFPAGIDYTVACATCVNPQVTYDVVGDCQVAQQFYVDVDVTDLGSASSLTLSDNQGSSPQSASNTGVVTFGPYPNTTDVVITVVNDGDANCTLTSNTLTQEFCQDFIVDCSAGPITNDFCYFNNIDDDPSVATFTFTSSDGTPLRLTFNSGQIESCCDELVVIDSDGSELMNATIPSGDVSGLIFQSTGDTISFYINSDISVSCESGSFPDGINYTVSCATCINPQATYAVVDDCDNGDQFYIDVNITDIGDATSLTVTDNQGSTGVQVTEAGVVQMGPYPFSTPVVITISNDQDSNCIINSSPIELAACPPINDNPCSATVAVVNSDFLCGVSTPGTLLEATPSGVPDTSCGGNPDDDVWFQFVANSEYQLISLANIAGSDTFNIDHAVYGGTDCGNLQELSCVDGFAELSSITPQLVVGNTYYIRVFSIGGDSETTTFDLCITPYNNPTNVACESATNYCNAGGLSTVQYTPNVVGMPNTSSVACLGTVPNPVYNILVIASSGDILIEIVQNSAFDSNGTPIGDELDVDYVLWGPFDSDTDFCSLDLEVDCPSCPNNTSNPNFYPFGNIVDCSYSANPYESITMEDAVQGQVYLLLVTNFEQEAGIIQITQTNFDLNDPDVGTVTGAINAVVENQDLIDTDSDGLGDEITVCQDLSVNPSVTLTANSPFADAYIWYQNGFEMEGENGPTLEVTETDNYILQVYDNQCGVYAVSQTVQVNLYNEAVPVDVPDITNCDDASNDGIGEFDLESQTAAILAGQNSDGFTVTYYSSLSDAQAGVGALSSPYTNTSNPQTIWVRVEDTNAVGSNSDCFAASNTFSFDLIISGPTPTVSEINYDVCDDGSNDGFASFDLSSQDLLVLGSQDPADFNVSYYLTENDAIAGTGALSSPYTNTVNPQTIWVRVESNASATCFSVGTMTLTVSPAPTASMVPDLGSCDSNGDTLPDFDLTMHEDTLLDGQTGMTVTYHTSQADADTGDNAIQVPSFYSSNTPATIYVRVESSPNCYNTTSFNLLEGEEPVTTITTDSDEFEICDNTTTPLILTAVPDNYNASEVSIVWYEDGMTLSGETGLTLSVLTGGYYEVEVTFNSTGCTNIVGQEVITLENCVVPQAISPNNDGKNDNFDLSAFDVQKLEIFNRYGVLVYSRTNYTNEWHGQSDSGDELPVGTYYYVMRYQGGKEKASWVYINK